MMEVMNIKARIKMITKKILRTRLILMINHQNQILLQFNKLTKKVKNKNYRRAMTTIKIQKAT